MKKLYKKIVNNNTLHYFLFFCIFFAAIFVRAYKVANPIADWHSWRQVDTASVTRIYVDHGLDLLHPRYYDISRIQTGKLNPEGYRFVEFPIYNYLHYLIVQNSPIKDIALSGRMLSIACALFTMFFLYLIGKKIIGKWGGLLSAGFYALIPYNIYFTRVILPEPMAVSFGIAGLYFYLQRIRQPAGLIFSNNTFPKNEASLHLTSKRV